MAVCVNPVLNSGCDHGIAPRDVTHVMGKRNMATTRVSESPHVVNWSSRAVATRMRSELEATPPSYRLLAITCLRHHITCPRFHLGRVDTRTWGAESDLVRVSFRARAVGNSVMSEQNDLSCRLISGELHRYRGPTNATLVSYNSP